MKPDSTAAESFWSDTNEWDVAHHVAEHGTDAMAGDAFSIVEPNLQQHVPLPPEMVNATAPPIDPCAPVPQDGAPLPQGPGFAWHLRDDFTELRSARDLVMAGGADVTVVHLDTGYDPHHRTVPKFLQSALQRNYVDEAYPFDASDRSPPEGWLKFRGHGTSTLSVLAGNLLSDGMVPADADINEYMGGAPLAKVVPVRVSNSVLEFYTSSIALGLRYARKINADVVTMSIGGLPSDAWAEEVNLCYDAGVLVICAAGTNYGGWPTSAIVWPARFERVMAVCGVMANHRPYYDLPSNLLQSNYGPASKMSSAIAAYAPNIAHARIGCPSVISHDGGGTSHATPQVAAAAALWLRKHKQAAVTKYSGKNWRVVEAARHALFASAKAINGKPDPYFGQGVVQAKKALDIGPPDAAQLTKKPEDTAWLGFLTLLGDGFFGEGPVRSGLFRSELSALGLFSPTANSIIAEPEVRPDQLSEKTKRDWFAAILDEGKASAALTTLLKKKVGH